MSSQWQDKAEQLARALKYTFTDPKLMRAAVTHRSTGETNNERLEFLGDSVLNFVIAAELYKRFPKAREGELTRLRALLVRGETVAEVARDLEIGKYLSLGIGEQKSGGYKRESILSDAMEAIIGAIYLDANIDICNTRILEWYETRLAALVPGISEKDAKTRLQEYCQARHSPLPEYRVVEVIGDPHNPTFRIECSVPMLSKTAIGVANSRRKAEQNAADAVLKDLKND